MDTAIFGYLLERALDPTERHEPRRFGGRTTRPLPLLFDVKRLVVPTVMEPLREQWRTVQEAVLVIRTLGERG